MKDIESVVDRALTVVVAIVVASAVFVLCSGGGGALVAIYLVLHYAGVC